MRNYISIQKQYHNGKMLECFIVVIDNPMYMRQYVCESLEGTSRTCPIISAE